MPNLKKLKEQFNRGVYNNEDDVKLHFYSDVVSPMLKEVNPDMALSYQSENVLSSGGRTDATFRNISFEFKKKGRFNTKKGIDEALYGRNEADHGLYQYILSAAGITEDDTVEVKTSKIKSGIGVGFDGESFLFARFIPSMNLNKLDVEKVDVPLSESLNLKFFYERKDFDSGLVKLLFLLRQQRRMSLTKHNLLSVVNTKSQFVRNCILSTYNEISYNLDDADGSNRVRTLYREWDRVFGVLYGEDEDATDFTEVSSSIREAYGIESNVNIDSKRLV